MKPVSTPQAACIDSLSPELQERLAEILELYLCDYERGLAPNTEDFIRQHPDVAMPLRNCLGSLDFLHKATVDFRPGRPARQSAPDFSQRQLGDYAIVREIGRGGMGIVYEAKQISLDRRVALKVLPFAAVLDQRQIARFYNEAQAAAHLQHPNIVPVFFVGCERGVHYYAMQYIDGQSLDLAIHQLREMADVSPKRASSSDPTETMGRAETAGPSSTMWRPFINAASLKSGHYFQTVAKFGAEAAEALEYAHQCGVIHRDVKPSNLMLDEQGKVWITDFGLARFHANGSLTATGDVMGTIRYMSPEQVSGQSALVDQRTDVYSLGITLYELVTLHEAFEGTDRQAFLRWISDEEPRPPRQINPAIPIDLETILLRAIAKSPHDRYATASALAEDLKHFMEGRPVLARRASLADRAGKWARRHKALAGATAAVFLVMLVGSVLAALLIAGEHAKTKAALAQSEANFHRAESNLRRAETHFRQLREVVDRFGAYHAEQLKDVPGAEPLRRELLLDALGYYRGFIQYAGEDATLQADLAVTCSKAAAVNEQIGDKPGALAAYRQAIKAFTEVAALHPDEPQYRADLALCYNNLGLLLSTTGNLAEAEEACLRAAEIQKQLTTNDPQSEKFQSDLALTFDNLGLLANAADQSAKAEQAYQQAIAIQKTLVEKFPNQPGYLHSLAASYNNLSFLQAKSDPVKAEDSSNQSRSIQENLVEAYPTNTAYRSDLALSYNNLGALENHNGRFDKAEASYRRAIAIQEQLVRNSPAVVRFRCDLAVSHNNLGRMYSQSKQLEKASNTFEHARTIVKTIVDDYPDDLGYHSTLGGILNNLGMVLEELGQMNESVAMYEQAIEHQRFSYEHAQQVVQFREFLAKQYTNYRRALQATGRYEQDAKIALEQEKLCRKDPSSK